MENDHRSSDSDNQTGGVHIGDVHGGIHDSIIAGGDVTIRAERLYVQATEAEAPPTLEQRQELERLYLERIAAECRYLETEGVDRTRAELTNVFVMLEAVESPRRQAEADVALLPERAEEMGLKEWATSFLERRQAEREEQAPFERRRREREEQASPPPPVPLSKALKEHDHLTILGEPGTGKTTTLQFIALCFATKGWTQAKLDLNEARMPVPIDLRAYEGTERLDRFLIQWLDHAYVPETLAESWLDEGRLAVLLDGLDEVPEARRAAVAEAIERFAATHEGRRCRIVVTSRIAGYRESRRLGADFDQYTIRPFAGSEEAQPYITGWLRTLQPEATATEAAKLLKAMKEQGGLHQMMSNPLLLRLAVAVYVETGEIARNRAELYRRYVQEVTWKRAKAREDPHWSYRQITQALEILAWKLQTGDERTEVALAELIEDEVAGVGDGRDLLNRLRGQLGLMAVYGYERGDLIAFRHLTFQEYFVARRLERAWGKNPERAWRFLRPRLHHPAWREPLLLLGDMLKKREITNLARCILKARSPYENVLQRDLLLAAAFVGDGEGVSTDVVSKITDRLIQLYLNAGIKWWHHFFLPISLWLVLIAGLHRYGDMSSCLISLFTLVWWGMWLLPLGRVFPRLQSILALPHRLSGPGVYSSLRARVKDELGREKTRTIESFLRISKDKEKLPHKVAEALVKFGGFQAVPFLVHALSSEKKQVRRSAPELLGQIGDSRAVEHLIRVLEDEEKTMRKAAAKALGEIGNNQAVPFLIQTLSHKDKSVSKAAMRALGKIGDSRAVEPLIQALENSWGNVAAMEALGNIGDPRAVEPLLQTIESMNITISQMAEVMRDKGVIRSGRSLVQLGKKVWECDVAVRALGMIGDPQAIPALIQILEDEEWMTAAEALGNIGDSQAVAPLIKALESDDELVRSAAAEALGSVGDSQAVAPLIRALEDDDKSVRSAAVEALGKIGDSRSVEPLTQALDDEWQVRKQVIRALEMIGEPAAESLTQSLASTKSSVRVFAKMTLVKIGDASVPYLVEALENEEERMRWKAAKTLGEIGNPRATRPLIHTLDDEVWRVRQGAAEALGEIGSPQAVEPLVRALKNWPLRGKAAEALGAVGDPQAVEPLIKVLEDGGRSIRDAMEDSLETDNQLITQVLVPVVQVLEDGNMWGQVAAAKALGAIGDAKAVEPLIQNLEDGRAAARRARKALAAIGEPAGESALQALGSMWGREAVAEALGQIGDPRAVEPLIRMLDNLWGRKAAAKALGKIGDPRAVRPLLKMLNSIWGRRVAIEALEDLGKNIEDQQIARKSAHRLWWRLTDMEDVANAAWDALSAVVARLTELEVEALDGGPPLFAPESAESRSSPARFIILGTLVAALSGLASNILAAYLQERYRLITDTGRLGLVVTVFVLTLGISIWLALRQEKRTIETAERN
jgi:HEAT repeat protein